MPKTIPDRINIPAGTPTAPELVLPRQAMNAPARMMLEPGVAELPDIGPMVEAMRATVSAFDAWQGRVGERESVRASELAEAVAELRAILEVADIQVVTISPKEPNR